VGSPTAGYIRSTTYLPGAHDPVHQASELAGTLGAEYFEIGQIKGTAIPIGLRTDDKRRGHIAILGMSGMGKTAVSQRVCAALGVDHVVVALDTTGEYQSRLAFPSWPQEDFDTTGHFVYQPGGDPPANARQLIEKFMTAGSNEYLANTEPARRMITLEEAHTFLPEWNFGLHSHKEQVANSTRMIMQARKFGLTFMLVSQRTAVVSKSALSQCENYIILKTLDHTGLEYLESLVGSEMRDAIPTLGRFEAMCVGPAFNAEEPVIISLCPPPDQALPRLH
jgi:DNA helicase HerA-like ATPase